nr:PREDICTED: uncharacterized protein LOC109043582 isoform X2 [Bemisia tabaci]
MPQASLQLKGLCRIQTPCRPGNVLADIFESWLAFSRLSSLTELHFSNFDHQPCCNYCHSQLQNHSNASSASSNCFETDGATNFYVDRQIDPEPCREHYLYPKQIQRIKLSPAQRIKLRSIQEGHQNFFLDDVESFGDCNSENFGNTPPFSVGREDPTVHHPNNLRGGTSDQIPVSSSTEVAERNCFINTGLNKKKTCKTNAVQKDSWEPFLSEDPRKKTCISCGKILREESDSKRPEAKGHQSDPFKIVQKENTLFVPEVINIRTEHPENMQDQNKSCEFKDDFQLLISNIDPEITLREFVLLFAPVLPDRGRLMKRATEDQLLKLLKNLDTLFTNKLEQTTQIMKSKHHSEVQDYEAYEKKISHQKSLLESKIQSILPSFDWEEYSKNEEHLTKALETIKVKFQVAGAGFQEARKRQHAQLQALKMEVGKMEKENFNLRTELESLKQSCEAQQSKISALPAILEIFKINLQLANKFHEKLISSAKLVAEFAEK